MAILENLTKAAKGFFVEEDGALRTATVSVQPTAPAPLLYQTAFNAFAALTGTDLPTLLASADTLSQKLADDRAQGQQRHREKLGESANPPGPSSPLLLLLQQKSQLKGEAAALTGQLTAKNQHLTDIQQQAMAERQKTQAVLASYELAHAAAAGLEAHRQATQSFLTATPSR